MIDESHISIGLFLRTVGIRNPFDDDEVSERSGSQRGDRSRTTARNNNTNGSAGGYNTNGGNDVLVPPEDSEDRQATIFTGSTALALTLSGSCAVEAPYAFEKCGLFWGTILFVLMALCTERVLCMLCICARKTGSNSYGTVARASCGGYRAHFQTSSLEIGVLLFLSVHYFALFGTLSELWMQSFQDMIFFSQYWMLLVVVVVMIPLLIPMKLDTLGYVWSVGLLNLLLFAVTVFIVAMMHFYANGDIMPTKDDEMSSDSPHHSERTIWDVVDGFQSFLVFFLASFNVLPIQAALQDPTRERMENVVHRGVIMGAFSTYLVGVVGYLCILASSNSNASIVEAIRYNSTAEEGSFQRFSLIMHRICHSSGCLSIMMAFPLILIPCRNSILEFAESIYTERHCPEISDCQEDCDTCTTRASTVTEQQNRNNAFVVIDNGYSVNPSEHSTLLPSIEENPTYDLLANPVAASLCTLGILVWAFLGAIVIPLMDYLYTWVGPVLVYTFAYILPCMYFLSTQRPLLGSTEKKSVRIFARVLIFLCIVGIMFSVVYLVHNLPKSRSG
jgi:amino acid permease